MATKLEVIREHWDRIEEEIVDCYKHSAKWGGRVGYLVYIWEDGEFETWELTPGSHGVLKPKEAETRQLYDLTWVHANVDDDVEDEEEMEFLLDWFREEQLWQYMEEIETNAKREEEEEAY